MIFTGFADVPASVLIAGVPTAFAWPGLGAVLAWFVIAAFVGSVLGMLTARAAKASGVLGIETGSESKGAEPFQGHVDEDHREAA